MSSSSNYRGRRGSGGYSSSSKPRRYWDSDDYHKRGHRDHDRDRRGRRSRSRSRSRSRDRDRSYSRSYSRSRSRSRSTDGRKNSDSSQPKPAPPPAPKIKTPPVIPKAPSPYDPLQGLNPGWTSVDTVPVQPKGNSTNANGQYYNVASNHQSQFALYQHMQQMGPAQPILQKPPPVSSEYGSFGGFSNAEPYVPAPVGIPARQIEPPNEKPAKTSKKKDKRKSRSSSSSSTSSSSSDSSDSRSKRKGKKTDSSGSSSDSSSEDEKTSKQKDKKKDKGAAALPQQVSANLSQQQREVLEKQQQGYRVKLDVLQREIKRLVAKEDELANMKADMKLIEENLKLQVELKTRVKAVNVVLEKIQDVLRGGSITADGKPRPAPPPPPKLSLPVAPPAPILHPIVQQVTLVPTVTLPPPKPDNSFHSFEFYDNGIHWCRLCNIFPDSVAQLLDHFHSEDHHIQVEQLGIEEQPWHKKSTKDAKQHSGATKKVPFRGMQFFTPVRGWYCKLCSSWMGDHHCSLEHLRGEEHHNNFLNFLDEHPDWEAKYATDREKARMRAGLGPDPKKPPVAPLLDLGGGVKYNPVQSDEDDPNTKSILVQMRRKAKEEEESNRIASAAAVTQHQHFQGSNKEMPGVDEWMGKPQKVALDIIDTQKFAAIVRQKHGAAAETKEKEKEKKEKDILKSAPPPTPTASKDRGANSDGTRGEPKGRDDSKSKADSKSNRKTDLRVELTLSNSRDRDRSGRDRGGRRRSRSRSRSRSRGRYDKGRGGDRHEGRRRSSHDRTKSRSRSRERNRSRDKDKDKESRKEAKPAELVKRLPIIGKMPLFGRKLVPKDTKKEDLRTSSIDTPTVTNEYGPVPPPVLKPAMMDLTVVPKLAQPTTTTYEPPEIAALPSQVNAFGYGYTAPPSSYEDTAAYHYMDTSVVMTAPVTKAVSIPAPAPVVDSEPLLPPGVKEDEPPGTSDPPRGGLPDDLQHALDIIYHGIGTRPASGSKSTVTPTFPVDGASTEAVQAQAPEESAAAESSFNYMDFQPYQESFEGYAPADYPDMESEQKQSRRNSEVDENFVSSSKPRTDGNADDDDMDDLRMLGIDVDDAAAANFK